MLTQDRSQTQTHKGVFVCVRVILSSFLPYWVRLYLLLPVYQPAFFRV